MAAKVQEFKLQIMHVLVDRTLAFGTGTRRNCLFSSEAFNALKSIIIPRGRSPPSAEAGANLKHLEQEPYLRRTSQHVVEVTVCRNHSFLGEFFSSLKLYPKVMLYV